MLDELIKGYSRSLKASERNKFYLANADEITKKLIADKVERERIILEALEKQRAEKVKCNEYEVTNGDLLMTNRADYHCPICHSRDQVFDIDGQGLKYCGNCGQKLEWEK